MTNPLEVWTCIFTGFGVILLAVYTYYTWQQVQLTRIALKEAETSRKENTEATLRAYEATQESNKIAANDLVLGRRSWLIAEDIIAPDVLMADQPWQVGSNVRNCGGIPATDIVSRFSLLGIKAPGVVPNEIEVLKTPPIGIAIVAPGATRPTTASHLVTLDKATADLIESGEMVMYIYCRLEYRDALLDLPEPRRSSGCWVYVVDRQCWSTAEKHNTAP